MRKGKHSVSKIFFLSTAKKKERRSIAFFLLIKIFYHPSTKKQQIFMGMAGECRRVESVVSIGSPLDKTQLVAELRTDRPNTGVR